MKNLLHISQNFLACLLLQNLYENLNADQLKRLDYLSENIRCPKCSYGNINSSNAPISKDLKQEIANLIEEISQMTRFLISWRMLKLCHSEDRY